MHKLHQRLPAAVLAVVTTAALLALQPAATHAAEQATGVPRVLIVGDSVTQGYRGDYTWRYFLWRTLAEEQLPVDLVGRRTGVFSHETGQSDWDYTGPGAYADPSFDQDHGASYGGLLSAENNFLHDPIGAQVTSQRPDVVIGFWGVNDLARDNISAATLVEEYRGWVAEARAADPDVDLVIGRLPATWLPKAAEFNTLIGGLAAELDTAESRVVLATMRDSYVRGVETTDDKHPSIVGQQKIAAMMRAALGEVSPAFAAPVVTPVPTPPAPVVVPPVVPPEAETATQPVTVASPSRPRGVKAVRHGARLALSWRAAAGADRYDVSCGRVVTTVSELGVRMKSSARWCRVRAANTAGSSAWVKVRVKSARG